MQQRLRLAVKRLGQHAGEPPVNKSREPQRALIHFISLLRLLTPPADDVPGFQP
jgi:hypothetical protein